MVDYSSQIKKKRLDGNTAKAQKKGKETDGDGRTDKWRYRQTDTHPKDVKR